MSFRSVCTVYRFSTILHVYHLFLVLQKLLASGDSNNLAMSSIFNSRGFHSDKNSTTNFFLKRTNTAVVPVAMEENFEVEFETEEASQQLQNGHITPVKFSHDTDPKILHVAGLEKGNVQNVSEKSCQNHEDFEPFETDEIILSSANDTVSDEEILHPLLAKEIKHFQEQYGTDSIVEVEVTDMAAVTMKIDIDFLDASIASAWFFKPNEYILLKLVFHNMLFLDGLPPRVSIIHQYGPSVKFPVGRQLEKIMEKYFSNMWPLLANRSLERILNEHLTKCKCGSLRELLNLGFPESEVSAALKQCGESVSEAASFLIDKGGLENNGNDGSPSKTTPSFSSPNCNTSSSNKSPSPSLNNSSSPKSTKLKNMLGVFVRLLSRSDSSASAYNKQLSLSLVNLSADGLKAKEVPPLEYGLLNQVYTYVKNRIVSINEFCVICDEPHVFQNAEWQYMLKPSVCSRELCCFSFQQMGVMNDATDSLATGAEVTDLLVALAKAALKSKRREIIFDPYPIVVDPNNPKEFVLTPKRKNFALLESLFEKIEEIGFSEFIDSQHFQQKLYKSDPCLYPLVSWLVMSNRSHIVKIPSRFQLSFMHTPHQFLLLSSPPSKEAIFQEAKKTEMQGSYFAFHGSLIENWHSILRGGLLVGTGTKHQVHGAAYGRGIYLSPLSSVSYGYSNCGHGEYNGTDLPVGAVSSKTAPGQKSRFISGKNITCIALCEVVNSSTHLQKFQNVWVCSNPDLVCTRFFFVYEGGQVGDQLVDTMLTKFKSEIENTLSMMSSGEDDGLVEEASHKKSNNESMIRNNSGKGKSKSNTNSSSN